MSKKTKVKAVAYACQSRDETISAIKELGDAQRALTRIQTEINDIVADATAARQTQIDALQERINTLGDGIHLWCEANRTALCGDKKSANLVTGEVAWRQNPPSVNVRSVEKVLERLRALKLERFIRTKAEVNKDAILDEPKAVTGIAGLTVVTGTEVFSVSPFEIELDGGHQ